MNTVNIKLYNILKNDLKLSEAKAQDFVEAVDEIVQSDINASTSDYKSLFKEDFYKLDSKIEQSKSDTLKWMMGIFITIVIMILGLYAAIMFKK